MNKANMDVLINVIGAVESGGQVYGKRRYDAYAAPYTNTTEEHTITLGWAQNYGYSARRLVQMIYDADPALFKKIDTAGIASMLSKDWVSIKWNPSAAQKDVLISLITSDAGKKCQDDLFAESMEAMIASCAKDYPAAGIKAQMMYCEIRHLGGKGPTDRIFERLSDYSLDAIMASLARDQRDKSNNNQVGDAIYWSRHVKCRQFIDQYATEERKEKTAVSITEKAISFMESIARDDAHGYSQAIRWPWEGPDFDCSSLVIYSWRQAGVPLTCTYTGNMKDDLLANGFRLVNDIVNIKTGAGLRRGDVLLRDGHTAMYCGDGKEVEAACSENGGIYGQPGDQTGTEILIQPYHSGWTGIWRYEGDDPEPERWFYLGLEVRQLEVGDEGADVYLLQIALRGAGFRDDDGKLLSRNGKFGEKTKEAVIKAQIKYGLNTDGICGKLTWAALTRLEIKYEEIR